MYSRILFNLIFIIGLFIIQFAFISGLPAWFANINLVIIVLIFIVGIGKPHVAFWWMLGASFLMELYSFMPFGIIIISMALAYMTAYVLLMYYFADRTLYSFLAITVITVTLYEILMFLLNYLISFAFKDGISPALDFGLWLPKIKGLAMDLVLVIMIYYVINYLSRNLKPVFLVRKK